MTVGSFRIVSCDGNQLCHPHSSIFTATPPPPTARCRRRKWCGLRERNGLQRPGPDRPRHHRRHCRGGRRGGEAGHRFPARHRDQLRIRPRRARCTCSATASIRDSDVLHDLTTPSDRWPRRSQLRGSSRSLNELGVADHDGGSRAEAGRWRSRRPAAHRRHPACEKGTSTRSSRRSINISAPAAPPTSTRSASPPREAIRMVRQSGGLPVLAHPVQLRTENDAQLERVLKDLQGLGLAGLEVIHSDHDAAHGREVHRHWPTVRPAQDRRQRFPRDQQEGHRPGNRQRPADPAGVLR